MSVLKSIFSKETDEYETMKDKAVDSLKSEYVVMGDTTRNTLTLNFLDDSLQVLLHGEDGITPVEVVHFKHIKSIIVMSKNVVAIDWHRGPYLTHDVSRFITTNGEAKHIRDKFYRNIQILTSGKLG